MAKTNILLRIAVGFVLSACYADEAHVMKPAPQPPAENKPDASSEKPDGPEGDAASDGVSEGKDAEPAPAGGDAEAAGPISADALEGGSADTGRSAPMPCPRCTRLFDGSSLDGWIVEPPDSWEAKGGIMANKDQDGQIYTQDDYGSYRVIFEVRRLIGPRRPAVVAFGVRPAAGEQTAYALAGIQWEAPHGSGGDYRPGKNIAGEPYFTRPNPATPDDTQWHRCEVLVKEGGEFRGACCPANAGPCQAVEILRFSDPAAGRRAPFAIHVGAKGSLFEYRNLWIETDPIELDLLTTR